jgi:CDP-diacylglycerol pyrophosphatase
MRALRRLLRNAAALALASALSGCAALAAADPNALWRIVGGQCVPTEQSSGTPGMCTAVDLTQRYAILKDINGATQFLLIPTERVTGIESPLVLAADAPDYWVDAWRARHYVEGQLKLGMPANQIGLEINSQFERSQSQLHIHIDCMRDAIVKAMLPYRDVAPDAWNWITLNGARYRVMRVQSLGGETDPFRIVARDHQGPDAMGGQTILVTGAGSTPEQGWLIVNSGVDLEGGSGSAEGLLDHTCRIAAHD